jgi:hypothetical protein
LHLAGHISKLCRSTTQNGQKRKSRQPFSSCGCDLTTEEELAWPSRYFWFCHSVFSTDDAGGKAIRQQITPTDLQIPRPVDHWCKLHCWLTWKTASSPIATCQRTLHGCDVPSDIKTNNLHSVHAIRPCKRCECAPLGFHLHPNSAVSLSSLASVKTLAMYLYFPYICIFHISVFPCSQWTIAGEESISALKDNSYKRVLISVIQT